MRGGNKGTERARPSSALEGGRGGGERKEVKCQREGNCGTSRGS